MSEKIVDAVLETTGVLLVSLGFALTSAKWGAYISDPENLVSLVFASVGTTLAIVRMYVLLHNHLNRPKPPPPQ